MANRGFAAIRRTVCVSFIFPPPVFLKHCKLKEILCFCESQILRPGFKFKGIPCFANTKIILNAGLYKKFDTFQCGIEGNGLVES